MADEVKKAQVPDALPAGFPSVQPHVNEEPYRYTIVLRRGGTYAVTSSAKNPAELLSRIFCGKDDPGAVPRRQFASRESEGELFFFLFPESAIKLDQDDLESIVAGWPPEDLLDEDAEDDEDEPDEDEDDRPRRKPKKRW